MGAKVLVALLVFLIVGSGVGLIWQSASTSSSFKLSLPNLNDIFKSSFDSISSDRVPFATITPLPNFVPLTQPTSAPSAKPTSTPHPKPKIQVNVPAPTNPPPCNRFKITHLDGSTSNLCYSATDYQELINLSYDLSSSQTFYNFHLKGVENYQKTYERTGSSIYLDAKASSQEQADREKQEIDQIRNQMYNIEKRGY